MGPWLLIGLGLWMWIANKAPATPPTTRGVPSTPGDPSTPVQAATVLWGNQTNPNPRKVIEFYPARTSGDDMPRPHINRGEESFVGDWGVHNKAVPVGDFLTTLRGELPKTSGPFRDRTRWLIAALEAWLAGKPLPATLPPPASRNG